MKHRMISLGLISAFTAVAGASQAQQLAFNAPSGTIGNQNYGGSLGLDFSVASSVQGVQVTGLGYFNSSLSGLVNGDQITVQLYSLANTSTPLESVTFAGTDGTLAPGSAFRFEQLSSPLTLSSGFQGAIVAYGFTGADPDYRPDGTAPSVYADPSGTIKFTGMYYNPFGQTSFPTSSDGSNIYGAGSFEFTPVTPEPGAYAMGLSMSVVGGMFLMRRRRRRQ